MRPDSLAMTCACCLLALASGIAWADDGCELQATPSALDYGTLNRTTLKPRHGRLWLAPRVLTLHVRCVQATEVRLRYHGQAAGARHYRFGDGGGYQLRVHDALLDGQPVTLRREGTAAERSWLSPGQIMVPLQAGQLMRGRHLSVRIEVHAHAGNGEVQVSDTQQLQAQGSFELAGEQHPLTLLASIAPVACRLTLAQGGRVDFGRLPAQQLQRTAPSHVSQQLGMNVHCDAPTRFAFIAHDNRRTPALPLAGWPATALFGLAPAPGGETVGGYALRVSPETHGDGQALRAMTAAGPGQPWSITPTAQPAAVQHGGALLGFGLAEGQGPLAIRDFSGHLQVELYLAPRERLRLRDAVPIDGAATLEIIYL